uniref:DUF4794 domain-containing protein n=1 Tax=Anopheles atroparvus TaxID=41427 RepID=A0AAG5DEK4_ANOAO
MMAKITSQLVVQCTGLLLTIMLVNGDSGSYASNATFRQLYPRSTKREAALTSSESEKLPSRHSLTTYDQRQNGKYNIHVNIKDVKIIAVDGDNLEGNLGDDTVYDYGDYDYDPAHLTVNPMPIFGSGISAVSITSTSKPPILSTKNPVSSTTKRPTTLNNPAQIPVMATISSNPSTLTTTSQVQQGSLEITSTESISVAHKSSKPVEHLLKPEETFSSLLGLHEVASITPSSSNIIKIKPTSASAQYDYQEIPVQVIVEPILRSKYRNSIHPTVHASRSPGLQRSYTVAVNHQPQQQRSATSCLEGEFRDREGNCRARRSGILKLYRLLSTLKDKND